MDVLRRVKAGLIAYISPPPKKQARPRYSPRRTTSLQPVLQRGSMSPIDKTQRWLQQSLSAKSPALRKVKAGRIHKTNLPRIMVSGAAVQAGYDLEDTLVDVDDVDHFINEKDELGGMAGETTLVEDNSSNGASSFIGTPDPIEDSTFLAAVEESYQHDQDRNHRAPSADYAGTGIDVPDLEYELQKRSEMLRKLGELDWTEAEVEYYGRVVLRGFEPVLNRSWAMDFRTLPESLFQFRRGKAFFCPREESEFRAKRFLTDFLALGANVKAKLDVQRPAEGLIRREIERYIKWSEKDGGYANKNFLPLIAIASPSRRTRALRPAEAGIRLEKQIRHKLQSLAVQYRTTFARSRPPSPSQRRDSHSTPPPRHHRSSRSATSTSPSYTDDDEQFHHTPPTLYGILILHSIVGIVTLDAAREHAPLRSLGLFDVADAGQGVWNALAVALLVVLARNRTLGLWDEVGEAVLTDSRKRDVRREVDPDA